MNEEKIYMNNPAPQFEHSVIDAEMLARIFHEAYEHLAPQFGYETREASRTAWENVPESNRKLMIATCDHVVRHPAWLLSNRPLTKEQIEMGEKYVTMAKRVLEPQP